MANNARYTFNSENSHRSGTAAELRQVWLRSTALSGCARAAFLGIVGLLSLGTATDAYALPTAGVVSAGTASISSANTTLTVNQSSQNAAISPARSSEKSF